jgi:hypothetical protein
VRVAVALDDGGVPQFTRIVSSAGRALNQPSTESARHSTYVPAVFRCKPVSSGYEFAVMFADH